VKHANLSALADASMGSALLHASALVVLGTEVTPVSCMAVLLTPGAWGVSGSVCVSILGAVTLPLGSAPVLLAMKETGARMLRLL